MALINLTRPTCTCIACGCPFVAGHKNKKAQYCRAPACRSEMSRRNAAARVRLAPVETAYHTILQPQIASYIASLAAANTPAGLAA